MKTGLQKLRVVPAWRARGLLCVWALLCCASQTAVAAEPDTVYLGASHVPVSQPGWERYERSGEPDAPEDEPMGGKTARGTPVNKRNPDCFPAEYRNVFSGVDMVASGESGALEPFDYTDGHQRVTKAGRDAIRGQNTW